MNNNRHNILWIIFPIINNLINLVVIKILSLYMNLGEFGDINLLKSITSFTIPLASLGLQQGLIRFLPQNNDEKNNFYNNIISFSLFYYLITSFFINFIVYIFILRFVQS